MKRLTLCLLFLTYCFILPEGGNKVQYSQVLSRTAATFAPAQSPSFSTGHLIADRLEKINPGKEFFKRRPVGLDDSYQEAIAVYPFDIRLLFVYIHTRYRTYSKTLHNVAINLCDWRGPPSHYS